MGPFDCGVTFADSRTPIDGQISHRCHHRSEWRTPVSFEWDGFNLIFGLLTNRQKVRHRLGCGQFWLTAASTLCGSFAGR